MRCNNIIFTLSDQRCAGKSDGVYSFSLLNHDCRQYVQCINELESILTCTALAGRERYFNSLSRTCEFNPMSNCNPGKSSL